MSVGKIVVFSIAITTLLFFLWVVLSADWDSWTDKPRKQQIKELDDAVQGHMRREQRGEQKDSDEEDDVDGDARVVRSWRKLHGDLGSTDRQVLGVGSALLAPMFPRAMGVIKELVPEALSMKSTLQEWAGVRD
jgi:hypothetical protein